MTDALLPRFTRLDEKVLAALPRDRPGVRLVSLLGAVYGRPPLGNPERRRKIKAEKTAELRGVLRGLEHLGKAECRGGWWCAR